MFSKTPHAFFALRCLRFWVFFRKSYWKWHLSKVKLLELICILKSPAEACIQICHLNGVLRAGQSSRPTAIKFSRNRKWNAQLFSRHFFYLSYKHISFYIFFLYTFSYTFCIHVYILYSNTLTVCKVEYFGVLKTNKSLSKDFWSHKIDRRIRYLSDSFERLSILYRFSSSNLESITFSEVEVSKYRFRVRILWLFKVEFSGFLSSNSVAFWVEFENVSCRIKSCKKVVTCSSKSTSDGLFGFFTFRNCLKNFELTHFSGSFRLMYVH